jgi:hypothetical protein
MLCTCGDGLLGTGGSFTTASETVLGRGVGVEGDGNVTSSDTGRDLRPGVDCADNDVCLLCAKMEDGDELEPSGAVNEER